MPYISAIKGGVISFIFFVILSLVLPKSVEQPGGVDVVLTISTFLFAILAGFFISRLNARYDQIRDSTAQEDASWLTLFELSDYFEPEFTKKVVDLIDDYYITAYDYELGEGYKHQTIYLAKLYELFEKAKFDKKSKGFEIYDDLVGTIGNIEMERNKTAVLWREGITLGQWGIIIVLGAVIILSMYFYGVDLPYFHAMTALLASVVVMVILTMRDLQLLRLGGRFSTVDESGEEVFEAIGKKRYYNQKYLKQGVMNIPKEVTEYRVGKHNPGEKRNIVLVKRKKS